MQIVVLGKGTFLKTSVAQSSTLLDHQRIWLSPGTRIDVKRYETRQDHYWVKFVSPYKGWTEGYVFQKHTELFLPLQGFSLLRCFEQFKGTQSQKEAIANLEQVIPDAAKLEFKQMWGAQVATLDAPEPPAVQPRALAERIVAYCESQKYPISRESGHRNIIYVEGMNPDGTLNADRPNEFNDLRLVIDFHQGVPRILGRWEGTTEPGRHYTLYPMNSGGAARVAFGSYAAWQVGMHGSKARHEALVQVANVDFYRDLNKDFTRTGDRLYKGMIGMNQHGGYDFPKSDIRVASAGCLVGRTMQGHREFMTIVKQDPRYAQNRRYIFRTAIIPGNELNQKFPP